MPTSQAQADIDLDASYGSGATIYACLTTSVPSFTGSGTIVQPTLVQYPGYAEVVITGDVTHWPAASAGVKLHGVDFSFPAAGPAAVANTPLTHIVFRSASTGAGGGRIIDAVALPAGTVIQPGQAPFFPAGSLHIGES